VDYTNTAGIKPGYQMAFDKDGDGGFDGFLVGEPDAYGMKWWDSYSFLTPKDASLAGCGYKICATLDDISAAYPQAKISAIGFSLGSGVKGDGVLSSLTFLDTTYTFGLDPVANGGPADIAVKLDAPLLTNVGTDIPLTVTVTNNGPNAAGPFNVSAVTPGYDLKSAPGGTVAGNTATIPVTYLDKGATKTFVVTAKASAGFPARPRGGICRPRRIAGYQPVQQLWDHLADHSLTDRPSIEPPPPVGRGLSAY